MGSKYKGSGEPILVDTRLDFHPDNGEQKVEIYSGTPTKLKALYDQYKREGIQCSISKQEPMQLTVTYDSADSDNDYQESWSLDWSEVTTKLYAHPRYSSLSLDKRKEIKKVEEDLEAGRKDETYVNAEAQEYYEKRMNNQEEYKVYQPIITQRIVQSKRGKIKVGKKGTGKKATISPPEGHGLGSIVSDYEWLKLPPRISRQGSRREIEISYLGADEWDNDLYGG